jgi:hypothetical protein
MDAHERRITTLEKTIPHVRGGGFQALIQPVNPSLDDEDPRLRSGVTEFEYLFPPGSIDPGRKEKRGLGFISPWCSVEFGTEGTGSYGIACSRNCGKMTSSLRVME